MKVLAEEAVVPKRDLLLPPNQFTHVVTRTQPYYFTQPQTDSNSKGDGEFPKGTRVVLLTDKDGRVSWVVDEHGLYAATDPAGLRRLPAKHSRKGPVSG